MTSSERPTGRGWFITIEGPDGGGKTSQAARLRDRLRAAGVDVLLSREPGGTTVGDAVREIVLTPKGNEVPHDPRTDALLFSAARAQHVAEVLLPALERGTTVISTRYLDSTLAYQGYGAGLPVEELASLQAFATAGLRPDLTILLDLPVEEGLGRKVGNEVTRFEAEFDVPFHQRVRDGFLALAAAEPGRYTVVDASAGEAIVADAILAAVGRLAGLEGVRGA